MKEYIPTTVVNKDAMRMAEWLLNRGRTMSQVVEMILGEMPWLMPLDVVAVVSIAQEKRKVV